MDQLGVFAKYWEPGKVKTRLATRVGAEAAAEVYLHCLRAVLENCEHVFEGRRVLAYAPAHRRDAFSRLTADCWQLEPQVSGDLGHRMRRHFTTAFAHGCDRAVLVGSDSPNIPSENISLAFRCLQQADVVLGPSADGGYYLIGMRTELPEIFRGIPWSTGEVYARTLERLDDAGKKWQALPVWYDVDEWAGLQRLRNDLAGQGQLPPRAAELLAAANQMLEI